MECVVKVKEMPTKDVLEAFLAGMFGKKEVIFNVETGKFEKMGMKREDDES